MGFSFKFNLFKHLVYSELLEWNSIPYLRLLQVGPRSLSIEEPDRVRLAGPS